MRVLRRLTGSAPVQSLDVNKLRATEIKGQGHDSSPVRRGGQCLRNSAAKSRKEDQERFDHVPGQRAPLNLADDPAAFSDCLNYCRPYLWFANWTRSTMIDVGGSQGLRGIATSFVRRLAWFVVVHVLCVYPG